MHTVRYASTDRTTVPVYDSKGQQITSGVAVQHTALPPLNSLPSKVVLLDTRVSPEKQNASFQQQQQQFQSVDKESLNMQPVRAYETKGDERLERVDDSLKQQPDALVQQMQKPLPSIPSPAAPAAAAPSVVKSSELLGRTTSETEPHYVTVYEDGAQLFSPRTINLLGTAARLPPPPPPQHGEPTTPMETMEFPATATSATTSAVTVLRPSESPISAQPTQLPAAAAAAAAAAAPLTSQQTVGAMAVPSQPIAKSEQSLAPTKPAVEVSTVRKESPVQAVVVEKSQPSPLIASVAPQPYDIAHPKNAIDVVQLPPAQPTVPVAVETVASNVAPLPLLPPTQQAVPAVTKPVPAPAPQALPAPLVSTAAVPALPAPVQAPRPSLPQTAYERAQPKIMPATATAPARAAPRRQWKMPGLFDVVFSPYAIGGYLLLGLLAMTQLPFWLLVTLAVGLDAAVIAYIKRPSNQPSTALVVYHAPGTMAESTAPIRSSVQPVLRLPAPAETESETAVVPSGESEVHSHHKHHSHHHSHHKRSSSREFGTQTEVEATEEHEEAIPVPRSPAEFFASLRQQHGGSPPAAKDRLAIDRSLARHDVPIMKKLAPSARQQATIPLLADAQSIAPEGVHLSESYHTAPSPSTMGSQQRYEHPVPHDLPAAAAPSPSNQSNPMLDALNSASPRRELNQLNPAVEQWRDMQPDTALSSQVAVAARRGVAGIPASDAAAAVQGAANPAVVVPTWPSTEQQHEMAQARQIVEASTVRDHSVLLDETSTNNSTLAPHHSQPYSMQAVPHSTTLVNQTNDMMALPAPKGPISTTAPLALPFPSAPSFRVEASEPAHIATTTTSTAATSTTSVQPAVQTSAAQSVHVKRVVSEEKEVVADVGSAVSVGEVGAGITQAESSALRLRNIAAHSHTQ